MASSSMKLVFFLQLLAMVLSRTVCQNTATGQLVYDTEGAALKSDESYYILPANGGGGGLDYIPTGLLCLNFVGQLSNHTVLGTPMQFTPPSTNASAGGVEMIRLSSDVYVEVHDLSALCSGVLDWHLTDQSPPTSPLSSSPPRQQQQLVAAGNQDGIRSYKVFQIKKHAAAAVGYKLAYCGDKGPACRDVGLFAGKEQTWLTLSDEPYLVVFKKRYV